MYSFHRLFPFNFFKEYVTFLHSCHTDTRKGVSGLPNTTEDFHAFNIWAVAGNHYYTSALRIKLSARFCALIIKAKLKAMTEPFLHTSKCECTHIQPPLLTFLSYVVTFHAEKFNINIGIWIWWYYWFSNWHWRNKVNWKFDITTSSRVVVLDSILACKTSCQDNNVTTTLVEKEVSYVGGHTHTYQRIGRKS